MYSPPYNRIEDRAELLAFLRANSFAVLVTRELRASHLPVQVRETESELILDMHMARANPQWQDFFDDEVLVVFSGPHAYVSPRWYEEQERVPTWNVGRREQELVAAALRESADSAERALAELMRKHLAEE